MPIQVVLGQVQDARCRGFKIIHAVQLKARQLQHPHLRQVAVLFAQGVQQCGADVASHRHFAACASHQQTGEAGDRGFAVGTGDGQHLWLIALRLFQMTQCVGKQTEFGTHPQATRLGGHPDWCHLGRGESWALEHGPHRMVFQQIFCEGLCFDLDWQTFCLQGGQAWRLVAVVNHRHLGSLQDAPTHHGQAGVTQAQYQDVMVLQHGHVQRNFRVDKPTKHNNMVMIQKRTTTWVSFQPDFSKWWCSGAIFKMRRPWPYLRLVYLK